MKKKVSQRKSKQQRFREIESALIKAGWGGLRISGMARACQISKTYAHKLVSEMVNEGLVERRIEYINSDHYFVNYVYYQLELPFGGIIHEERFSSYSGSVLDYDNLNAECTMCGKEFEGSFDGMCASCRQVWNG